MPGMKAVKKELGLKGRVALYVGQLIPRKGVDHLIRAWALLPGDLQRDNSLLIVGGGDLEGSLRSLTEEKGAINVYFAGSHPPHKLAHYYAAADFFVLPSLLDVWGLVANEAMASGVPVLCSKFAGCANELVVEGVTGSIFDPRDCPRLADLLSWWVKNGPAPPLREAQFHIRKWNIAAACNSMEKAIWKALSQKCKR